MTSAGWMYASSVALVMASTALLLHSHLNRRPEHRKGQRHYLLLALTAIWSIGLPLASSDLHFLVLAAIRIGILGMLLHTYFLRIFGQMSSRSWAAIYLEGALWAVTFFTIVWGALGLLGLPFSVKREPGFYAMAGAIWLLPDLLLLAMTVGLSIRGPKHLMNRRLLSVAAVGTYVILDALAMRSDTPLIMTGPLACVALGFWALSSWGTDRAVWGVDVDAAPRPRENRLTVYAAAPALLIAATHGDPIFVATALITGILLVVRVTTSDEMNEEMWKSLRQRATTDELCGLMNRATVTQQAQQALEAGHAGLAFLDLDGFKAINDSSGHELGDHVLKRMAEHLRTFQGPDTHVARLGGDEFAILTESPSASVELLGRLKQLNKMLRVDTKMFGVTTSIGFAEHQGGYAEQLLRDADTAMYHSKQERQGAVVEFTPDMRDEINQRKQVEHGLISALGFAVEPALQSVLEVDFQPIYRLPDVGNCGFEALIRWRHNSRRLEPNEFLSVARQAGLMNDLGSWVLRHSLRWLAAWPHLDATLAVNTVGAQVTDARFVSLVREELNRHRIRPERLTLEITEQTPVDHLLRARDNLKRLRSAGVQVALDDFGTGFSSFRYLDQLPVDAVKIDQSFVAGLGSQANSEAIVTTVLSMASDLNLTTVAEGVETTAQLEFLVNHGCDQAQGYLLSRPIPGPLLTVQHPNLSQPANFRDTVAT